MKEPHVITFVPSDTNGLPQKRAASQRACEHCRRRKKRCEHASDSASSHASPRLDKMASNVKRAGHSAPFEVIHGCEDMPARGAQPETLDLGQHQDMLGVSEPPIGLLSPATVNTSIESSGADHRGAAVPHHPGACPAGESEERSDDESRFIGHLNPEGMFLAATSPAYTTGSGEVEEVGVWSSDKGRRRQRRRHSTLSTREPESDTFRHSNLIVSRTLLSHIEESCLSLLPVPSDLEALSFIYFDQIHPIFPIVDRKDFDAAPSHLASKIAISQLICLIASSSPAAKPFLRLRMNGVRVSLERAGFAHQLSFAVRTSLNLGLVKDKFVLCQICALLSMSLQLADDRHLSAEMCARAIVYAQTLGLHLPSRANSADAESFSRVFCCVWALDRLNAAFHGRPVLMHGRDFGRNLEASISAQDDCFQLVLRITVLLDEVIDLYRPKSDDSKVDWGPEFPDFESIVDDAGASRVKHNLLATVETFYHAVAMLSCRSQSLDQRRSPSYVRQSLSAFRVISMVTEDFAGQLSPLPIVPYAVSLALRFFYREFRFTRMPLFRARAQKQLIAGCGILQMLGEAFTVAAGIANLLDQTLCETDKAYRSVLRSHESERVGTSKEPEMSRMTDTSNTDTMTLACPSTTDWSLWEDMPEFNIFEHFDPNFNLGAVDAVLTDDTRSAFPITHDGFSSESNPTGW